MNFENILNNPIWNYPIWNALSAIIEIFQTILGIAALVGVFIAFCQWREQQRIRTKPRMQKIIDMVIVPFIEKLQKEINSLEQGDIGWNYMGNIYNLSKIIPFEIPQNLIYKDFQRIYPKIHKKILKHDKKLEDLVKIANNLAQEIEMNKEFNECFNNKIAEYQEYKTQTLQKESGGGTFIVEEREKDRLFDYIIEWLINNKYKLEWGHTYFDFWQRYSPNFFAILDKPEIKEYKEEFENIKKDCVFLVGEILKELNDVSMELTEDYGLEIKK
jgi:hypothetical protein